MSRSVYIVCFVARQLARCSYDPRMHDSIKTMGKNNYTFRLGTSEEVSTFCARTLTSCCCSHAFRSQRASSSCCRQRPRGSLARRFALTAASRSIIPCCRRSSTRTCPLGATSMTAAFASAADYTRARAQTRQQLLVPHALTLQQLLSRQATRKVEASHLHHRKLRGQSSRRKREANFDLPCFRLSCF